MSNITGVVRNINTANQSVGQEGSPIPDYANLVGASDPSGNLAALKVDASGKLLVDATSLFVTQNLNVKFNEVSSIIVGSETTIGTYTAPATGIAYLLSITAAGENRASYQVYNNGVLVEKQYTNVTQLSAPFDYKTGVAGVPGYIVAAGNVLTVTVINSGTSTANFNSRIMVLETT